MESTRLLHAIIETAIDGIITIDSRGRIENLNPSALKIFGYREEELIGKNISVLMPEPDHSRHDGYLLRYQSTGEKNNW
jgi:PAS domain S-box-containing protein